MRARLRRSSCDGTPSHRNRVSKLSAGFQCCSLRETGRNRVARHSGRGDHRRYSRRVVWPKGKRFHNGLTACDSIGVVVAARPIVKAVGIFRVKFHATEGVIVRLTEVYIEEGELREGRFWTKTGAFGQQYVDAGEELPTTVVFPPIRPPGSVIGWLVYLKVAAPTRLMRFRSAWWMDQVFVPRPDIP